MTETLHGAWEETRRRAPDAMALTDIAGARTWTRADLDAAAQAWRRQHVGERDLALRLVVFAEPNGVRWWEVFLGLLASEAVIAALDPGEPLAAQRATAMALRAGWLWTGGALEPVDRKARRWRDGRRVVKLTSGSTGAPRALPFTDAQMLADGRQVCTSMGIGPDDVNLGVIPFGHSYGLGNLVLPLLAQGSAIVTGIPAWPQAIADACAQARPTIFPAVPALLKALAETPVAAEQLASVRTVISAGAALDPAVAQAFFARFGRKVHSFYGSSETGGISYDRTGDAALTGRSVGTAMDGVRLTLERARRLRVESRAVFTLGNRRRSPEGWGAHRPADQVEFTDAGELVLRGRAGRWVKIAGRRLNLSEVEQALKRLPGVRDALVELHAERADAVAAIVATDQPAEVLRAQLRERLAGWKVPKRLVTIAAFPLTARGKTDSRALRERLRAPAS